MSTEQLVTDSHKHRNKTNHDVICDRSRDNVDLLCLTGYRAAVRGNQRVNIKKIKKGQSVNVVADGVELEHTMLFSPVIPTGKGQGKVWEGIGDDNWKSLYDALRENNTRERNAICEMYHVSYQKLRLMFQTPNPDRVKKPAVEYELWTPSAKIAKKQAEIQALENQIEALHSEIAELKVDAIADAERWLEELKNM